MLVKRETVAAVILLIAGGCGSGGDDAEDFTLAAVQPFLARLAETSPVRGGVAKGASEAVRLRLPSSAVTVLFAADADAASALALEYGVVRGDRSQLGTSCWRGRPYRLPRRACGRGVHHIGRGLSYSAQLPTSPRSSEAPEQTSSASVR